MSYINGFLIPVPNDNKQAYIDSAKKAWPLFKEYGVLHYVEGWGDDIRDGKTTDFKRAVKLKDDESVVFAWMIWPDKATADKCEASMQTDERWKPLMDMPFDGKRMVFGGFETVFEQSNQAGA